MNKMGDFKRHIYFAHVMSIYDTTSDLYNKAKKKTWNILAENAERKYDKTY